VESFAIAHNREAMATTIFPRMNTFTRPVISAILPSGTKNTADARRNDMATQLMVTAFISRSLLILGRAIFTEAPKNGAMNELTITSARMKFFFFCISC
jgi:hypothetical protein